MIKSDKWIRRMAVEHRMIEPFEPGQVRVVDGRRIVSSVASVEMALDDIRVLASAAAQSQREAFELVHQRLTANIDEVQRLLRK